MRVEEAVVHLSSAARIRVLVLHMTQVPAKEGAGGIVDRQDNREARFRQMPHRRSTRTKRRRYSRQDRRCTSGAALATMRTQNESHYVEEGDSPKEEDPSSRSAAERSEKNNAAAVAEIEIMGNTLGMRIECQWTTCTSWEGA